MRKAINFFRSYYDVAKELSDKDRLAFYDAILKKQFENIDTNLTGMANFAYVSQKHSITSQIKGYYDKTKDEKFNPIAPPTVGATEPPSQQGQVQVQGQEEEEVKEQTINIEFIEFWNLYNKKVGNKDKAEKKWNDLKDNERQKIIDTLPKFIGSIKDKQFQPHPLTYLNNSRWNDEIENNTKKDYRLFCPNGVVVMNLTESELAEKKLSGFYKEEHEI